MTLNEYQQAALRTAPARLYKEPLDTEQSEEVLFLAKLAKEGADKDDFTHAAMGLCTESGELMDVLKKHRYYGKPIDWVNVTEEIGDCAWYLALACRAAGTTLEEVCAKNIAKLRARYPEKFTQEAALNRNVEGERVILETLSVGTGINHPV